MFKPGQVEMDQMKIGLGLGLGLDSAQNPTRPARVAPWALVNLPQYFPKRVTDSQQRILIPADHYTRFSPW